MSPGTKEVDARKRGANCPFRSRDRAVCERGRRSEPRQRNWWCSTTHNSSEASHHVLGRQHARQQAGQRAESSTVSSYPLPLAQEEIFSTAWHTTARMEELPNLASAQLNSEIVFATDEWFAAADNMLQDAPPVWKADLYTDYGKWMDGWESRRRRTEGHDWCLVKLGVPAAQIHYIEVDTAFFTGNFSPKVSIQGVYIDEEVDGDRIVVHDLISLRKSIASARGEDARMGLAASPEEMALASSLESEAWPMLVPLQPLGAGYEETRRTIFTVTNSSKISHLRVNMGPDGGIARLRVYGDVFVNISRIPRDADVDLASVQLGGRAVAFSNAHYGHPRNLVAPGRGTCMGDGWETARQPKRPPVYERGPDGLMLLPGCDWCVLKLGLCGVVTSIEIDTNFYKGNYPESCLLEGCYLPDAESSLFEDGPDGGDGGIEWRVLLPRTRLSPSAIHGFALSSDVHSSHSSAGAVSRLGTLSHVRMTIYPDGGVMRLRLFGRSGLAEHSRL